MFTTNAPSGVAIATKFPEPSIVAEFTVVFSSKDHWVINCPLPQKCSDKFPSFVNVRIVEDDVKEV